MKQNVLVIGAGLSGLVTAKTLLEYGHAVTVFEKEQDIGGVWTPSRRYPGLSTQNTRDTYAFSDFPMPADYPEFPSGEQMLAYLNAYSARFGLESHIRLGHTILSATPFSDGEHHSWTLSGVAAGTPFQVQGDYLVVCNGIFCEPAMPNTSGMADFVSQGGTVLHSSAIDSPEHYVGKRVAVVGFGKSACDIAAAIAADTEQTYLIYRQAKWKVPKRIRGINYKYIILTRFGEALTKLRYRNTAERLIHFLRLPRRAFSTLQKTFSAQQHLEAARLLPAASIADLLFGELSVESDGFYQKVIDGQISAIQGEISDFLPGGVYVPGTGELPLDTVIFGTGFRQTLPFLSDPLSAQLVDADGNYLLYRNILPLGVPALAFVGYNSSFFCNLTSEIAALWLCEHLEGRIALPSTREQEAQIREYLAWRKQYRQNALYHNASVYPFNLTYVDWLLKDMNASLPWPALLSEWLKVVEPGNYAPVKAKIKKRSLGQ
ncbi:MAG: NAD(P)/FAD-dependent oxidoreductase [Saprospiraceae bacterium]|nr:NAD(P)/FAD-dependent oxidoreductase [Saprospiraceae bacterium]